MYGYIYKTTNNINGMIYIGQHKSQKFDNYYKGSGKILLEQIKIYGKENFKVEILEWCETRDKLNEREIYWIKFYKLPNYNIGYNISKGGQTISFSGKHHSMSTLIKQTKNKIDFRNPSLIKKIISSYINGKTIKKISEDVGLSISKCRKILLENDVKLRTKSQAKMGIPGGMGPRKLKDEESIHTIISLYINDKYTTRQIANIYGVSKHCISDLLKRNNVELRPPYRIKK